MGGCVGRGNWGLCMLHNPLIILFLLGPIRTMNQLTSAPVGLEHQKEAATKQAVVEGEGAHGSTAGMSADDAALQARLDNLRRG